MAKIKMTTPIVEMDGDEMTRILWKIIKENLLEPFIELNIMIWDWSTGMRPTIRLRWMPPMRRKNTRSR